MQSMAGDSAVKHHLGEKEGAGDGEAAGNGADGDAEEEGTLQKR